MRHATPATLATIPDLLEQIRKLPLREPKPGTFYIKSSAFLHFHEDPAGLFADLKVKGAWKRLKADTAAQRKALVQAASRAIGA